MNKSAWIFCMVGAFLIFLTACTIPPGGLEVVPGRVGEPVESGDKTLPEGCNNDGTVDATEACDDGNFIENDACDRCRPTVCGDAIVNNYFANSKNVSEACDPGKNVDENGLVPGTGLTPQQYANEQCRNNTGRIDAGCLLDTCICAYDGRPACGNFVIEGGPTPFGWRGEGCDAPDQATGDLQCLFLGLGDTCNLNTCSCSGCNYDGFVDPGEQCDDGNFVSNDECDACIKTHCGDGFLDNNPKNWDGIKEECGEPGAPLCPADKTCKECRCQPKGKEQCIPNEKLDPGEECDPFLPGSCPEGKLCTDDCKCEEEKEKVCNPNGKLEAGEQCDPGVPARGIAPQGCDESKGEYCEDDCTCKGYDRVITPRCGDGYVSTPWKPGGGNEECDIGGGYSNMKYPPAPDTCPAGMQCQAPGTPNQCKCLPVTDLVGLCPEPYETLDVCQSYCEQEGGTCDYRHQTDQGVRCYSCYIPACPEGTTDDLKLCEKQCSGKCQKYEQVGDKTCYQCMQYQCPSGTVSDQGICQQQCTTGDCYVAAEKDGYQCWGCKMNCEKYCSSKGYSTQQPNYESYIQSELDKKSCVTSANVQLPNYLTAGECVCYSQQNPTVTFDETRPICTNTICGDVPCGEERTCNPDPETQATVSCNWGGWKQVGALQWVPIVGAS